MHRHAHEPSTTLALFENEPASAQPELAPRRAALLAVHARLCAEYSAPIAFFHDLDPLSELVSSLLSHRTRNADSGRAFQALRGLYPNWAALRDAPVDEVARAIVTVTWPEQKAPRIQQALRAITAARGGVLSLDFLAEMTPREARDWLESLPGVGPKTSAAVLLFSNLRRPALPVDSHHHRVARRLGLLPANLAVGPAHTYLESLLPHDWGAQEIYDHHEVLMLHGQRCCHYRAPACRRCAVLDLCPIGAARVAAPADRGADARHPNCDATGLPSSPCSFGASPSASPGEGIEMPRHACNGQRTCEPLASLTHQIGRQV